MVGIADFWHIAGIVCEFVFLNCPGMAPNSTLYRHSCHKNSVLPVHSLLTLLL